MDLIKRVKIIYEKLSKIFLKKEIASLQSDLLIMKIYYNNQIKLMIKIYDQNFLNKFQNFEN